MLWLNRILRTYRSAASAIVTGLLLSCAMPSSAQTVLTVKGDDAVSPFYLQNGALLYVQGGISIDNNGGSGGANDYIQNNGTIRIAAGTTPNLSGFTNNVIGLKTYSTGQTTGEVILQANNETQVIGGGGTVEFMKLTVNNTLSPVVVLNEDVQVDGLLTIGGLIQLQSNNLTLSSTGALAGAPFTTANMIQADGSGEFVRGIGVIGSNTSFTFPVGDGTPNYTPAVITFAANTQAGNVGIKVTNSTQANNNTPGAPYVYLSRYWSFSNTLTNYTYTGSFAYPTANLSDVSKETALKLSRWDGGEWDEFAGSSAASNTLTQTSTLAESTAPLTGDFTGRTQCINPVLYNVTGGTHCNSVTVGLSNSQTGVNYQLILNDTTSVGSTLPGSTGSPLNFGVQNTPGTYTIVAVTSFGGCVSTMNGSSLLHANPTVYDVTGGLCVPVAVGLENSQTGVWYQLVRNGVVNVGSPIAGTGNALTFPQQNTTGSYSVVATDNTTNCTATMNGVFTVGICTTTWTGSSSADWFDLNNWNPQAVPNQCQANVIIPVTATQPEISGASVNVGNVSIASGAVLTLTGQNLNVCGNWTGGSGSNAAVVGSGTVILNSVSGVQNISGNTRFNILQLNNTQGAVLAAGANVSISTGLHLQTGNLDVTAGTLRLLSASAGNNSYIDDFTQSPVYNGTITGDIIADRYVPVIGRNQHFVSSPVNSPSLTQVGASGPDGSYVLPTPNCDEKNSGLHSPYGSCFVYNDGYRPEGYCMLGNWMVKSAGNMENGKGYSIYLMGNSTLSLTGEANTGAIEISGLNNSGYDSVQTLQGQWIESGWNLVGNPYPSAIDITQTRIPTGFQNQVQLWVTSGPFSGSWQAQVIDNLGHIRIAPFQAFMVRTTHGSTGNHTYQFYQNERIRNTNVPFYRTNTENTLQLELDYKGVKDVTKIAFNPSGTYNFDDEYDANKYNGSTGRPTLYTTLNTGSWYAINTLPALKEATTVPVGLRPEANGVMNITARDIETFDPTTYIYLEDKLTGKWHNLRDGAYTFATTKTDSQSRFVVHFTPPANILTTDASCEQLGIISIEQPGSANWNYTLTDETNNVIATGSLNSSTPVAVSANAGIYNLALIDNVGYTVIKSIVVGGSQPVMADFTTSITSAQVLDNIAFNSTTTGGAAYSWNFGDGSTASGAAVTHVYHTEGVYMVSLAVTGESGCIATTTRSITVTSGSITGVDNLAGNKLNIWSHDNTVYVDFSKQGKVDAEIDLYNVLGQLISHEKFGRNTTYSHALSNLEAAYIIVKVRNLGSVETKRVFIINTK